MAIVATGFEITLTALDNGRNASSLTFVCDPAVVTDLTTAEAARAALQAAFQAVSGSAISRMTIKQVFDENALALPGALVENENKASLSLQIAGRPNLANIKIPAGVPSLYVGSEGSLANVIDPNDAALGTYVNQFAVGGPFFLSDGEHCTVAPDGIVAGKRISAKNNNG